MDAGTQYEKLKRLAENEFADLVKSAEIRRNPLHAPKNLRILLKDNSFLDIYLSNDKYSYHWQAGQEEIYRHDNAPHKKHEHIQTFPKHFHKGKENKVEESHIPEEPQKAIRHFLNFIQKKLEDEE